MAWIFTLFPSSKKACKFKNQTASVDMNGPDVCAHNFHICSSFSPL